MGLGHDHSHSDGSRNLAIAFLLNLSFAIFELAGGIWTNSVAIISDALHDAGDSLSLGVAWFMERVARRGRDEAFTYGYRRFSVLGALITSVVLILGLAFVVGRAIERFQSPEPVHAPGMMLIALVGIAVNAYAAWRLSGGRSLNESVASWHLLEDVLGWVAVLIGAVVVWIWKITWIDPLLSLGISVVILWNVVKNLKRVASVFLQRVPDNFSVAQFLSAVKALPGVDDVHHTHVWTVDGEHHVLTTHLVMPSATSRAEVIQTKEKVRQLITADFEHVTIDVELAGEECISNGAGEAGHHGHQHSHHH